MLTAELGDGAQCLGLARVADKSGHAHTLDLTSTRAAGRPVDYAIYNTNKLAVNRGFAANLGHGERRQR
jgi:hypothetical protein